MQTDDRGKLDELLREVAKAPEVPIPPPAGLLTRVAEGNVAALRQRLADLHRDHPERCPGDGCPCRAPKAVPLPADLGEPEP